MLASISSLLTCLFLGLAHAQFQFFEQMFQGGGQPQQHQQPQNVASDSQWYQQTYESGRIRLSISRVFTKSLYSSLRQLPMSRNIGLCSFPSPLPMSLACSGRQSRIGGRNCNLCFKRRIQSWGGCEKD